MSLEISFNAYWKSCMEFAFHCYIYITTDHEINIFCFFLDEVVR
jgi:hypothetical protein